MGIVASIRDALTSSPAIGPASQARLDAIERRAKLRARASQIADKKLPLAKRLAELEATPARLPGAEATLSDGQMAVALGESPALPLDSLREAVETARQADEEARQEAITLRRALVSYEAAEQPLYAAQRQIRRELNDSAPAVWDEQLWSLWQERQDAEAALRAVIRKERLIRTAFDIHARENALGDFRGSRDYAELRIPAFTHPRLDAQMPQDVFARGAKLAQEHTAFEDDERAFGREVEALRAQTINGE